MKPRFDTTVKTQDCPICRQPFDPVFASAMPFCSERCRLIDLGRWLDEEYGMPHEADEEELDEQVE